ncbi:MAG: outer membrane protein assembly factor BamA [Verrucomicrobiae bacterium]|nr:outer membrane protein assembly factor BamA [Verrucomicrobiae bacterium]
MNILHISKAWLLPVLTVFFLFHGSIKAQQPPAAPKTDDTPKAEDTTDKTGDKDQAAPEKKKVAAVEDGAKPREAGAIVREVEIRFAGPKTTSDSVVQANMRTKVGEPFTQTNSDDDVRALYATGLFSNVRILQEKIDAQGVKVIVILQGKSKLKEVVFEGNKRFNADKLRKQIKLKPNETLSEKQVAEAANTLIEFYQKAGYYAVKINFEITPDELTGLSIVKYIITEGAKLKIDHVDFKGNKAFTTKVLRKKIETRNWNWISWLTKKGYYKETVIDEDKDKIAEFYRSEGYIDAEVKDVKLDKPTKDSMVVTFFVFEGNQYKVGSLTVTGNQLFTLAEIDKKLVMKAGKLFTPGGLQGNIKAIQDLYGARGYIDTVVKPTKTPNVQNGTMDVALEIREGDLAYIDLIKVNGNLKTKDKVIRRELAVAPGEIYNTVKVDASKRRLENLGYFSKVSATAEETDVPNRKNLVISVEEQRTGSISFGAGFSSVDSILGFVEVSQGNFDIMKPPYFTGAGQKARVRAQFGARRQDYVISFTEPWFLNQRLAVGTDLFYKEANYYSALYNERRYGFDLRLGKGLGDFNRMDLTYTLENIEIYDMSSGASQVILDEKGKRSKSSVLLSLSRDTRDDLTLPTRGYKVEAWSEVAGGPALGGQTKIYKMGLNGQIYFLMPWWEKNILSFNGSTGTMDQWDDADRVPLYDRFFMGGPSSVRGFKYRNVGPKDNGQDDGEPIGGKTMAFVQTEYTVPVIDRVRFATFVDTGQVWSKAYNYGPDGVTVGAGIGLRLNLPIGSINLDYGWPIRHPQAPDSGGQFSFSGGTKF